MAEKAPSRGRGAALKQLLQKHKEEAEKPVEEPPAPRGRSALLKKLQELKEAKPGPSSSKEVLASSEPLPERKPVQRVTQQMTELSVEATSSEPCSYQGESGKPIRASANYIRLEIEEDRGVFEYDVRFNPDVDAKSVRCKLVNQALGELAYTKVYDGDVFLYLPRKEFDGRTEFPGVIPHNNEPVVVIFTYRKKQRMSECLHLYNVLFKRIMYILLYKPIGRNYFDTEHKHLIPQHKLEVYPGYAIAVDEMEGGLMVCLDTQHRVVRSQTALELMYDIRAANPRGEAFRETLRKNLIGCCVMTKYNNKTYILDDINFDSSPKETFELSKGGSTNYIDYYKNNYNITVTNLDQPLLMSKLKSKKVGTEIQDRIVCLLPELCYLTGLTDAMRSDFRVMKDVAAFTRVTPGQRMMALRTYLNNVRQSEAAQKVLAGWGLHIAGGTTNVNARVLPRETIFFGSGSFDGGQDWNRAVSENRVVGAIDLQNWLLVYTPRDEKYASNFSQTMVRLSKNMGCIIRDPRVVVLKDDRSESYMSALQANIADTTQAVVIIFPSLRADRYSVVKKVCCVQNPIASQVILSKTLSNPSKVRTIIHKIAMQINCKLGGTLWTVKMPFTGWMVCGIDVYHGLNQQSVCGFVASTNESLSKYYSEVVFQEREIGDFFKVPFRKALQVYKTQNGNYPSKIVCYRDGVGDGQLEHCKRYELAQFEEVLREMNVNATVTFIVVQKRISTRIYELKGDDADNPPAGTVVDSVVTRRNYNDFYLIPQSVRQGTVNPAHYIVVYDSANIKPDHVQRLTYKLCHLYYNWSGTIRVPAPCQYAHKIAQLVGMHLKRLPSHTLSDKLFYL